MTNLFLIAIIVLGGGVVFLGIWLLAVQPMRDARYQKAHPLPFGFHYSIRKPRKVVTLIELEAEMSEILM